MLLLVVTIEVMSGISHHCFKYRKLVIYSITSCYLGGLQALKNYMQFRKPPTHKREQQLKRGAIKMQSSSARRRRKTFFKSTQILEYVIYFASKYEYGFSKCCFVFIGYTSPSLIRNNNSNGKGSVDSACSTPREGSSASAHRYSIKSLFCFVFSGQFCAL